MSDITQEQLDRLKSLWEARTCKVQWTSLMIADLDIRDDDCDLTLALHNTAPDLIAAAEEAIASRKRIAALEAENVRLRDNLQHILDVITLCGLKMDSAYTKNAIAKANEALSTAGKPPTWEERA